jgi:branched-chain amino acid transport system ATP-binding protein
VKNFGAIRALDNVSLNCEKEKIYLVIGPNGSGKTTLINCISGLIKPDKGRVFFKGEDITGKPPHEIVKLGLVRSFQIPMPFYKLTVMENMLVSTLDNPGEMITYSLFKKKWSHYEQEKIEKAFKILELLELDHLCDTPAKDLSGGQLKLLELGRLMMLDVDMCLLDEPAGSINPVLASKIFLHIQRLRDNYRKTFLIIEHRLDIALKYVDYVYAMAEGKTISHGLPEKVVQDPAVLEAYIVPTKGEKGEHSM